MTIDKLNKTFTPQQILTAEEMNQITSKIDNLVDGVNDSQSVLPFDTELNESSNKGLPNSVIAKSFKNITDFLPVNTILRTTEEAGNIFGEKWLKCDGTQVPLIDYPLLKLQSISAGLWDEVDNQYKDLKCAYGNDIYVAIGDGFSLTSSDGINWERHDVSQLKKYDKITFYNGIFYTNTSINGEYIAKSTDGINWDAVEGLYDYIGLTDDLLSVYDISSDSNYLIIAASSDGSFGTSVNWVLLYKDGEFKQKIHTGSDSNIQCSGSYGSIGICYIYDYLPSSPSLQLVFTQYPSGRKEVNINSTYPNFVKYLQTGRNKCQYFNGKYIIACNYNGSVKILSTTNGDDLQEVKTLSYDTNKYFNLYLTDDKLVLPLNGKTYTSTDGTTWNESDIPYDGYYCKGNREIVISETKFQYVESALVLPNIENHYIKAK